MAKCANCGFLSARNKNTRELVEVEKELRENGDFIRITDSEGCTIYDTPVCFMQRYDLPSEYDEGFDPHKILGVLNQDDRDCKEWAEWHQGFTPKEHKEMIDRKEMLAWQAKRENADKDWRAKQEDKHSREEWLRYIFLCIVTILATLIAAGQIKFVK